MAKAESGGKWIPKVCTRSDLAALFGVSIRTIQDLDARGVIVRGEGRGQYLTKPSIDAYLTNLRKTAAGRTEETKSVLATERLTTERVSRQIQELKLAQMKGEILTLDEVAESWGMLSAAMKAAALTIPAKARTNIPHLTAHDGETLKSIVRDMLNDLADEVEASVIGGNPHDVRLKNSD